MPTPKSSPKVIRHQRIRKKVQGTTERPRLSVHFSGKHIYAQVIDDDKGVTIAAANTTDADFKDDKTRRANQATAERIGKLLAERRRTEDGGKVGIARGGF